MSGHTIVVLGGGWGGLAAAHALRKALPAEDRVVIVEQRDTLTFRPSFLWLMTGERDTQAEVERPMSALADPGIEWIHEQALDLDPTGLRVVTASATLHADFVILAVGSETSPDDVAGFRDGAHNLYEASGALALRAALSTFESGELAVVITRLPFRCPAAPYEAVLLIDAHLRHRGVRDRVRISVYTPEKQPMPVAGPAVGSVLRAMLEERGIRYRPEQSVSVIDAENRTLRFADSDEPFDLLVGIPPHVAPLLVRDAGLVDATGYVPVHPQTLEVLANADTLETRFSGLYAIGDVTSVRLHNGMLLPKAGVFAESEARVVAANITSRLRGERETARFDGAGFCYVEVGDGMAAYGGGNFYAYPRPIVAFRPPSSEYRIAKEEFERTVFSWFTHGSPSSVHPVAMQQGMLATLEPLDTADR